MDEEGRAYEAGYEQGFIDGAQKNAEFKVTKFIEQNMRSPLTDEQLLNILSTIYGAGTEQENMLEFARAIERAHGIGEEA